jgi:predicted AlkP superfamily phosphohydrolase/phosphomutase
VFINTRGVYGRGIVEPGAEYDALAEEIRGKLARVIDPETGRPFCVKVWRREELYRGPALQKAPDILMELVDGYEVVSDLPDVPATLFGRREVPLFKKVERGFLSGAHTHEGILIATGRAVRGRQSVEHAQITDLAPTICALLGVPPMPNMDGRVLREILDLPLRASAAART